MERVGTIMAHNRGKTGSPAETTPQTMKQASLILTLAALLFSLPSCSTYVDGTGYAGVRPGHFYRPPAPRAHPHSHYYSGNRHNRNYHPSHHKARHTPPGHWNRSRVNTRANAGIGLRPVRVSSSTGVRLF